MALAALEVEELSYRYPEGGQALERISFAVPQGERVALLGPNGAGKSTLLWCLVGVLRGEGRVTVEGMELKTGTEAEVRRKLGLVFSEPDDQLFMPTIGRDIAFGLRAAGESVEEAERKARVAVTEVGLSQEMMSRPPYELSSGERRRAALAGILAMSPAVLALDEPTNSLDARGRWSLAQVLASLSCAQLIATHDLEFARRVCGRALILAHGRIAADMPMDKLANEKQSLIEHGLVLPMATDIEQEGLLR